MNQKELLLTMKKEADFLKFGIMLELYALTAQESNDFSAKGPAMKELQGMLSEHILFDYYYEQLDGDAAYIRSRNKALLTYVYCSLKEWFPNPDMDILTASIIRRDGVAAISYLSLLRSFSGRY